MVDNTVLPGTGETYAADDIEGVKFQRVKLVSGIPGKAVDTSSKTPLPITDLDSTGLLKEILIELKEMNFQLMLITETSMDG